MHHLVSDHAYTLPLSLAKVVLTAGCTRFSNLPLMQANNFKPNWAGDGASMRFARTAAHGMNVSGDQRRMLGRAAVDPRRANDCPLASNGRLRTDAPFSSARS